MGGEIGVPAHAGSNCLGSRFKRGKRTMSRPAMRLVTPLSRPAGATESKIHTEVARCGTPPGRAHWSTYFPCAQHGGVAAEYHCLESFSQPTSVQKGASHREKSRRLISLSWKGRRHLVIVSLPEDPVTLTSPATLTMFPSSCVAAERHIARLVGLTRDVPLCPPLACDTPEIRG